MHIVLVQPQIPQNTGSIARTCAATQTPLHLIHPLGFSITEKAVRRAGLDYWPYVELHEHKSWEEFLTITGPKTLWYFSTHGKRTFYEADFQPDDYLVFGSETAGLGKPFLESVPGSSVLRIPMPVHKVRSLNLSNTVSVALYEAIRQIEYVK